MKIVKYVAIAAGIVVLLAAAAITFVVATFDPNDYKPQIIQVVKGKYDRTLTIDGPIELKLFPRIGAAVNAVTLSERGSGRIFARLDGANVAVALMPLLSRRILVDRVEIDGLAVELVRRRDGASNFDDLVGKPAPGAPAASGGPPPLVDVGGIFVRNGALGWRDEAAGTALQLSGLGIETGRIASGVPGKLSVTARVKSDAPKVDAAIRIVAGYRFEIDKPAAHIEGLEVAVEGDVAGVPGLKLTAGADLDWAAGSPLDLRKLRLEATGKDGLAVRADTAHVALGPDAIAVDPLGASLKLNDGQRRLNASLAIPAVKLAGGRTELADLGLSLDYQAGDLVVQGKLATPLRLDLDAGAVGLARLAGNVALTGPTLPGKAMQVSLAGSAAANWLHKTLQSDLNARFDGSTAQLKLELADYSKPAPVFDLVVDKLDLDRYLPGSTAQGDAKPAGTKGAETKGPAPAAPAKEEPIDLSALKSLDAAGRVRIGALVVSKLHVQSLDARLKAAGGHLDITPITAQLYQGSMSGSLGADANANRYVVKQQLTQIAIGPLLKELAAKDLLEGRGNVMLDVTATGTTVSALKRSLAGRAGLQLRDGAIKGFDLAAIARKLRSLRSGTLESSASGTVEKTDFTEFTASFTLRDGVARNQDLSVKSPFVRITGAGDIDIGAGTLDYGVKAAIVASATGQEGKALGDVRGITFPLRLTGPFTDLKYSVDAGALAAEMAKSEVTRRLEERLPKSPVGEALKGLFGR